jgi:hypothetical protein
MNRRDLLSRSAAATLFSLLPKDSRRTEPEATTVESRTVSVRINRPLQRAYDFLAPPENWNTWAAGLGKSIRRIGNEWVADSSDGQLKVRFTPRNAFGVVDHYVKRSSEAEIYVPMRLLANGTGSELLFTLFRESSQSDERLAADLEFVKKDLNVLKAVLEE